MNLKINFLVTRTIFFFYSFFYHPITGIIQGMKLWPFEKFQNIVTWCIPLLQKALDNMTVETQRHWGSCIATALVYILEIQFLLYKFPEGGVWRCTHAKLTPQISHPLDQDLLTRPELK